MAASLNTPMSFHIEFNLKAYLFGCWLLNLSKLQYLVGGKYLISFVYNFDLFLIDHATTFVNCLMLIKYYVHFEVTFT